jgi:hypothetical protein
LWNGWPEWIFLSGLVLSFQLSGEANFSSLDFGLRHPDLLCARPAWSEFPDHVLQEAAAFLDCPPVRCIEAKAACIL